MHRKSSLISALLCYSLSPRDYSPMDQRVAKGLLGALTWKNISGCIYSPECRLCQPEHRHTSTMCPDAPSPPPATNTCRAPCAAGTGGLRRAQNQWGLGWGRSLRFGLSWELGREQQGQQGSAQMLGVHRCWVCTDGCAQMLGVRRCWVCTDVGFARMLDLHRCWVCTDVGCAQMGLHRCWICTDGCAQMLGVHRCWVCTDGCAQMCLHRCWICTDAGCAQMLGLTSQPWVLLQAKPSLSITGQAQSVPDNQEEHTQLCAPPWAAALISSRWSQARPTPLPAKTHLAELGCRAGQFLWTDRLGSAPEPASNKQPVICWCSDGGTRKMLPD